MKFIKVRNDLGFDMYLNIASIESVYARPTNDGTVFTQINTNSSDYGYYSVEESVDTIMQMIQEPTKRGHWIFNRDGSGTCSECGHKQHNCYDVDNWDNFCHFCGADMRG